MPRRSIFPSDGLTPKMREGLGLLYNGNDLGGRDHCIGRPTKQRLAKFGLAEFVTPKDWDGPMRITEAGRRLYEANH